jgi:ribosomal protein S12 methylthiotransferase
MPWIRPMYLHPAHVNDRLVERWATARVVPYLDLPVQHADDAILRSMRRAVTARRMRDIVAQFRAAMPEVTVRTTVLVGFPGETEAAFERLLEFVDEVRFDRLGVFTYSPEEGTASPSFADQVSAEVAAERASRVQEAADTIAWEREDKTFAWEGRTAGQAPEIDGVVYLRGRRDFSAGRFARARITEVEGHELVGERA